MNANPLVSVIIPNFNHAPYLDRRIRSVLAQTYDNYEVIILDDNSCDNSLEVISRYRHDRHVSRIDVNKENSGCVFRQWSRGMELAKGELVWIAESDDYCEDNLLEELVRAFLARKNTVLAYSTLKVVNDEGVILEELPVGRNRYLSGKQFVRRYLALANFVRNASCALFLRDAALSIPKDYQKFKGAGDYLFWTYIALKGNVAIVNKCLSYFRRHGGVVTDLCDANGANYLAEKEILDYICSQVRMSGIRLQVTNCYHWNRIRSQQFLDESVKRRVYDVWGVPDRFPFWGNFILRKAVRLRLKYNYYI
mgnify:CR=1 FL=1